MRFQILQGYYRFSLGLTGFLASLQKSAIQWNPGVNPEFYIHENFETLICLSGNLYSIDIWEQRHICAVRVQQLLFRVPVVPPSLHTGATSTGHQDKRPIQRKISQPAFHDHITSFPYTNNNNKKQSVIHSFSNKC